MENEQRIPWWEVPLTEAEEKQIKRSQANYRPQCGYCGRFVPRSAVHKAHDRYSGATGAEWDCPSCGKNTSTI